ncbi:MAG TPA: hypothetical protein VJ180_03680 [Pyrinomonadaceae bacterium]|nr:hypothetical protein [Pyrinomonadaceae bacterium]
MGLALEVGILADLRENDEEGYEYFRSFIFRLSLQMGFFLMRHWRLRAAWWARPIGY